MGFKSSIVNDRCFLGFFILGNCDLLGGVALLVAQNHDVLNGFGSLGCLEALDFSINCDDVVFLKSFNNGLDLSLGIVDLVGGDSFSSILVLGEDGGCGFLGNDEAFINKLELVFLVFHDHHSVVFVIFLGHNKELLDVLAFFDFDVLDQVLSESGLDFVEVVENFLCLNVFGQRFFGDNLYFGLLGFFHLLEFFAEDFLNGFNDDLLSFDGVPSDNPEPEPQDDVVDDEAVLFLGNFGDFQDFNLFRVVLGIGKDLFENLLEVVFVLD